MAQLALVTCHNNTVLFKMATQGVTCQAPPLVTCHNNTVLSKMVTPGLTCHNNSQGIIREGITREPGQPRLSHAMHRAARGVLRKYNHRARAPHSSREIDVTMLPARMSFLSPVPTRAHVITTPPARVAHARGVTTPFAHVTHARVAVSGR